MNKGRASANHPAPLVHSLPLSDQPDYRVAYAPEACNTIELLAALIGGPRQIETAQELWARYGDLDALLNAPVAELMSLPGVGQKTAVRIRAGLELGRRLYLTDYPDQPTVKDSNAAAAILRPLLAHCEEEQFRVMLLNVHLRLLRPPMEVCRGSVTTLYTRPADVFREAVRCNATAIIVGHNHPSGSLSGSKEDYALTNLLSRVGRTMGIEVLDHIIVAKGGRWTSLKEWPQKVRRRKPARADRTNEQIVRGVSE